MIHGPSNVKYSSFFSDFTETLNFLHRFFEKKKTRISRFIKLRPVEVELFNADGWMVGWTDRHTHDAANTCFTYPRCERV